MVLSFPCPNTNRQVPTDIATDARSLALSWRRRATVECPHCRQLHEISVRETYINRALEDAVNTFSLAGLYRARPT
jgi:hypothetical protein